MATLSWTNKTRIQRFCAALPIFRDAAYFAVQRYAGSLRHTRDPRPLLQASASMLNDLQQCGVSPSGKRAMEIGTGRYLEIPIGLFLAGAASVLTVDVQRLLKADLVLESLRKILANRCEAVRFFEGIAHPDAVADRLDTLARVRSLQELFESTSIEYWAPADSTNLAVASGSIDLQFSIELSIPTRWCRVVCELGRRRRRQAGVAIGAFR